MEFELMSLGFQILNHSWFITTYPSHRWSRLSISAAIVIHTQACLASGDSERKFLNQTWSPVDQLVAGSTRHDRKLQNTKELKNIGVFSSFMRR